ncbi:Rpn family recombination-promoting nuclease/putative transposase [Acanthopleuribacter pedis]|uniref:Rpn family recombination-promoting nuclease/putative transposase n=1 Tax=Acanthopleuribacter pedis TaxID=442870 RepID=A0A8J7Q2D6_9BACT|nr:Rpn family recombination-promoting nuclease/putative transposase [Acanthopleuribacter pedis]MBO1318015.1 Rpn family recombination-promoting nuclease/putative transposase [Acanthopleuribacter pedis]
MNEYDSPWKHVCDDFFSDLLSLFLPPAFRGVDWTKPVTCADKELPKPDVDNATGLRIADKLYRVYAKEADDALYYLHIEIQSQPDPELPDRMAEYNFRIKDKFKRPVISMAILDHPEKEPVDNEYLFEKWTFSLSMRFPAIKLWEYKNQKDRLWDSPNPVAVVVLAHLIAQDTSGLPRQRFTEKLALVRHLYQKPFSEKQFVQIFRFLDWILTLPDEPKERFKTECAKLEGAHDMTFLSTYELDALNDGKLQERRHNLTKVMAHRFTVTDTVRQTIDNADFEQLGIWFDRVLVANNLEEVFAG